MGDEAELRAQRVRVAGLALGEPGERVEVGGFEVRVTPPDDDEYMAVRAIDLVGKTMRCTDVLGATVTGHLEGGFVVLQYDGLPSYHRTLIRSDAWVRVKRHV